MVDDCYNRKGQYTVFVVVGKRPGPDSLPQSWRTFKDIIITKMPRYELNPTCTLKYNK